MGKGKIKPFVLGCFVGGVLMGTSAAFASPAINAVLANGVKYVFDGQTVALPDGYTTINYNGHEYVPLRFIADQFGAEVGWDPSTQTVTLTSLNAGSSTTDPNGDPSEVYQIEDVTPSKSGDSLVMKGQIHNISTQTLSPSKVTVTLYDDNKNAVGTGSATLTGTLAPDQTEPFTVTIEKASPAAATYLIQVE